MCIRIHPEQSMAASIRQKLRVAEDATERPDNRKDKSRGEIKEKKKKKEIGDANKGE
jgi:hypothetical protein